MKCNSSVENMWSVLYTTGCLTKGKRREYFQSCDPQYGNTKFLQQDNGIVQRKRFTNGERLDAFCTALKKQNTEEIQRLLVSILKRQSVYEILL